MIPLNEYLNWPARSLKSYQEMCLTHFTNQAHETWTQIHSTIKLEDVFGMVADFHTDGP